MQDSYVLKKLDIYNISRDLSRLAWENYLNLELDQKIMVGQQFIRATDSVGANIAEGYGRYHYLDKIKFYYNSRASLLEAAHWLDVINERGLIEDEKYKIFNEKILLLHKKLNSFIKFNIERKCSAK